MRTTEMAIVRKRRGRPPVFIEPGVTHVPIETGYGVMYGKIEHGPPGFLDIDPYTGEPLPESAGVQNPAIRADAPDISPFREDDR